MNRAILITGASSGIGRDTLRYRAGKDAIYLLDARSKMPDDEYFAMQKQQLGL